jgi:signal transduction histidine kinase
MDLIELLRLLQVVVFLGLAVSAVALAVRRRTRPPAYLAAAFTAIGLAVLSGVVSPDDGSTPAVALQLLSVACLAHYPWLLAGFAWSFEGPLPRGLKASVLLPVLLTAGFPFLPPFPDGDASRTTAQVVYLAVFVASWAGFSAAMAVRLWRAGSRQRLVRARMRLMASGAILLTLALFIAVMVPTDSRPVTAAVSLLVLTSAWLFAAGFTPPAPLRLWWRRRASHEFQRMQLALIAALTPAETATVVAPLLANLVGGGVMVLEPSGHVLAAAHLDRSEIERLVASHREGRLQGTAEAIRIGERTLLVRSTPFTPVFGEEERELIEGFALQMRLALERAELYQEAERARQDAEDARAELEGTLVGLAHDLKSPTLAISGFVGLLPDIDDPDERDEIVGHIEASSVYLRSLVDALVEVSRVGHTQTRAEDVDLGETFSSVARRVRGTHPEARIHLEGACPTVRMNPVRAEQMIDNLVGNAVRHGGRPDLTVTILCRMHDDGLTVEVADDGRGIDPGDRDRIFGLFQRGRSPAEKGSGVGLGMARRIAQTHGGTLTLGESERGARFVIHLPPEVVVDWHEAWSTPTLVPGEGPATTRHDGAATASDGGTRGHDGTTTDHGDRTPAARRDGAAADG